ncbi:hypothetical protein JCM21900_006603 [Sporobolomyces salmonicolor]
MQPHSLPRSLGSIDLTHHTALSSSSSSSPSDHYAFAAGPSHPSLLVTDSSADDVAPSSLTDEQYLAKMTSATRTLLAHPPVQSSGHLSSSYPTTSSKALSRISEYSESAYSADGANSTRNSREPQELTPSGSNLTITSESSSSAPTNPSFLFPAPPSHKLPSSGPGPSATLSPPPYAAPALPGSPQRSHLPSRPITAMTTPLPTSNPAPVPVPIVNFANPAGEVRSDSPYGASTMRANGPPAAKEVMVQLPGRAATTGPHAAYQYHHSKPSDATTWTASGMTVDSTDLDAGGGAFDTVSLAPSGSSTAGGASHHRFTLDHHEKSRGAGAALGGAQGWEKEGGRRKGNQRLLWCLVLLAVVGVAVGVGVGIGAKKHTGEKNVQAADPGAAAAESSSSASGASSSSPLQTVLLPSSSAAAAAASSSTDNPRSSASRTATAVPTYSTTFAYGASGRSTVVPLTYTIPSSYDTRPNGQWQFTEQVVLPSLSGSGSFTSELRFRVAPTGTASAQKRDTAERRNEVQDDTRGAARRWERQRRATRGAGSLRERKLR